MLTGSVGSYPGLLSWRFEWAEDGGLSPTDQTQETDDDEIDCNNEVE
jgi:hypothetical protein